MTYHNELIKCPECQIIQWAKVEHTLPWFTRIHECTSCKYLIMESEWDKQIPKVLTLWQPWATLYAHRIKLIETRPKPTSWTSEKGSYLIHAASKWSVGQAYICHLEPFKSALKELGYFVHAYAGRRKIENNLPLGAIIGAVDIEDCAKIVIYPNSDIPRIIIDNKLIQGVLYPEKQLGDYREGRYAWISKNHRVLKDPIPYKNGQGYYLDFKGDESKLIF